MTGPAVLVTGATGLVGTELVAQLRERGAEVVGTSRRGSAERSEIVAWDMGAAAPPERLRRSWDVIVNTAANTRWRMDAGEATAANVASLRGLVPLVGAATRVVHVSTAYATGLRGDVESADQADYRNTYEWSKAHAERVARESFEHLTVVRPPLIVGRREDGRAARFAGMYTLVRGLTIGTIPAVVADPAAHFDAIPVDDLCRLLVELTEADPGSGPTVTTIAAGSSAPLVEAAIEAIVEALNRWRLAHRIGALDCPPVIEPERWRRFHRPFAREHLSPRQLLVLELLESFEPYLALVEPLRPDLQVEGVLPCLRTSTTYWAEANDRVAALEPRPWRSPTAETIS